MSLIDAGIIEFTPALEFMIKGLVSSSKIIIFGFTVFLVLSFSGFYIKLNKLAILAEEKITTPSTTLILNTSIPVSTTTSIATLTSISTKTPMNIKKVNLYYF